jgi:hypothetical protein
MNWQDIIRTLVRPIMIAFMGFTSWQLVLKGIYNPQVFDLTFVQLWIGAFLAVAGEWMVIERPLLKIAKKG